MNGRPRYNHLRRITVRLLAGLLVTLLFASCGGNGKQLNRRILLRHTDKNPYGTHIAYEGLPWIFPDAEITINKTSPQSLYSRADKKALIFIGSRMDATPAEVSSIMNFVGEGNHVFLSATWMSDTLLHTLGIRTAFRYHLYYDQMDSLTVGVFSPVNAGYKRFTYPGDSYDSYITILDSQYTSVLGRDEGGRPNFVRISYKGGGAIYLHFAPLAFSNFFLLHKKNIAYYENALSYIPPTVKEIIWDEYFRYGHGRNGGSFSALQYILNGNAGLRMGFWLLLLLFLLIYLFDSKRRQRMVPAIAPLRNTSLDFVQTIGRLYFQRRDNRNLATKMAVHFQDQVRTHYHLPVTTLDEEFVNRLSYRTGYPKEQLQELVEYMRHLPLKGYIPDEELVHFHRQLEAFYKHT
ncbi:MAG TPA: DUF4350 domain-containing protein [Puia sp.]|nr:DUF4350 domain-containing protein [Puia sp.]